MTVSDVATKVAATLRRNDANGVYAKATTHIETRVDEKLQVAVNAHTVRREVRPGEDGHARVVQVEDVVLTAVAQRRTSSRDGDRVAVAGEHEPVGPGQAQHVVRPGDARAERLARGDRVRPAQPQDVDRVRGEGGGGGWNRPTHLLQIWRGQQASMALTRG